MSIISQNSENEVAILDCIQRFFAFYKVGSLLKKCNGTKEKGVPAISLLRYKLSNIFVGRSMYMQQRTGSFKENFSKNTFYRFLNSSKTNWFRFTSMLASQIINDEVKNLTDYTGTLWFFRNYPFLLLLVYLNFASNNCFLQCPYIVRFIIFNRLFVPSTKPLL